MNGEQLLEKLQPNPTNPRTISQDQFKKLKRSLKGFAKMLELRPIAYDEGFIVWGGNMRLQALKQLAKEGLEVKDTYFKELVGFSEKEKQEFAIRDNVEFGDWDLDLLTTHWDALPLADWGVDLEDWLKKQEELRNEYSQNIGQVAYEPGETKHQVSDLYQPDHRFDEEIEQITNPEVREFLRYRSYSFCSFNFSKIADYYASQATPEEQRLFEKLALILLDKDRLIEFGFSKLIEGIEDSPEQYDAE